jgi:hypothetical protein
VHSYPFIACELSQLANWSHDRRAAADGPREAVHLATHTTSTFPPAMYFSKRIQDGAGHRVVPKYVAVMYSARYPVVLAKSWSATCTQEKRITMVSLSRVLAQVLHKLTFVVGQTTQEARMDETKGRLKSLEPHKLVHCQTGSSSVVLDTSSTTVFIQVFHQQSRSCRSNAENVGT